MVAISITFGRYDISILDTLENASVEDVTILAQTSSVISVGVASFTMSLYGSFDYNTASNNTVTGVNVSYEGNSLINVSGVSLTPALAQSLTTLDDLDQLLEDQFSGNDSYVSDLNIDVEMDTFAGNDLVRLGAGNDDINGGLGRDRLFGGAGEDLLYGAGGRDLLVGQSGSDRLFGGRGGDVLRGGSGSDLLDGQSGADRLIANGGRDTLIGGAGDDTFIFGAHDGRNVISDFGRGDDLIMIRGGGASFEDLSFKQVGDHTLITYEDTRILVQNWQVDALQEQDHFLF